MSKYGAWDSSPTQPLLGDSEFEEADQVQVGNEETVDANSSASLRAQDAETVAAFADKISEVARLMTTSAAAASSVFAATSAAPGPAEQTPLPPSTSAGDRPAAQTPLLPPQPSPRFHFSIPTRAAPTPAFSSAYSSLPPAPADASRPAETLRETIKRRWLRARRYVPATVERSLLAYSVAVCAGGATGLFCIPLFPLLWECAGVLPVLSIVVVLSVFAACFVVSLLPDPQNLLPGLAATAAMLVFYVLRLAITDKFRIRGLRSFGDYLLGLLTLAELVALCYGVYQRRMEQVGRQQRGRRRGGDEGRA